MFSGGRERNKWVNYLYFLTAFFFSSRTPNSVSVESQVESNLPEAYTSFTKQMGWDNKDDSPVNTLYKSDAVSFF